MRSLYPVLIGLFLLIPATCHAGQEIDVITTIQPLEYFIEKIGGKHLTVTTIIPPGGNPHTYEPSPRQMNAVSRADLYVKVGSGVEFEIMWMERLRALNKDMAICDVSAGIDLIEMGNYNDESDHHIHGARDPHIWLSPVNGIIIAGNINRALTDINPENSKYFSNNTARLINKLNNLIKEIRSRLRDLNKRAFLVFHPSWGYFARDFNLTQIPIEFAGKEITPDRLSRIIKKAKKEDISVVFASPQFSKKSAAVIANEIKGKVLMIDPMKKEYMENLRSVSSVMIENMQ